MKTLDFNKLKPRTWTIVLQDEKKSTFILLPPTKALMDQYQAMLEIIVNAGMNPEEVSAGEILECKYFVCTKILNHNKNGKTIKQSEVEALLNNDQINAVLNGYTEFVMENSAEKN